jgi:Domain of unknown function (DUF1929)
MKHPVLKSFVHTSLLASFLTGLLVACPGGSTEPTKPEPINPDPIPVVDKGNQVETISVFVDRGTLGPGETGTLRVVAKDASGAVLTPTPKLTWTSSKPSVAGITSDGTGVLAKTLGGTTITASVNGKTSIPVSLEVQTLDAAGSIGRWSNIIDWPVTVAHASLMPDGTLVTFPWRKTSPWGTPIPGLGYAAGGMSGQPTTRVDTWNPSTDTHSTTWETKTDMFGAGHDLLEDGRLFVSGGSAVGPDWYGIKDNHAFKAGAWSAVSAMNVPRWYPSVTTLGSGEVLVSGGVTSLDPGGAYITTDTTEVWNPKTDQWRNLSTAVGASVPLYPRMQVAPDGSVVMTGPATGISRLNTNGTGSWTSLGQRDNINRVYGSSVLYDQGKVLELGGSNPADPNPDLRPASNTAKVIDLNSGTVSATGSMAFGRRNLNATVLPDQTVLVTGGNAIGNGNVSDFSGSIEQRFQKESELWDSNTGSFRLLASESVGRPYHSVALLLADARVFSAGGYDQTPFPNSNPNYRPSYKNAQIFSPPYLFTANGTPAVRPEILEAPSKLGYNQAFDVRVGNPDEIGKACLIRLGSVTHAFNFGQRYLKLNVQVNAGKLELRSPNNSNLAPPGFYYLFVLDRNGVPSVAKTIRLTDQP